MSVAKMKDTGKSSTGNNAIVGAMAVAGMLGGALTYFISVWAFNVAIYLGAPIVFVIALIITYGLLHRKGRVRLQVSAWRVVFVSVAVVVAYSVIGAFFESASRTCAHFLPGNWAGIGAFLALSITGVFCAGLAWMATTALISRLHKSVLLGFTLASVVSAIASSLASAVAARNMDAGYAVVLFLFPGVLFMVGMTLFAGVFGYAFAQTNAVIAERPVVHTAGVRS